MAIWDFLTGEFIDVISWTDDSRDTMVWRFEREGHAIKYGAKLTVREGQAAVFVHEGQIADVFGPGLYMLETNNLPVLTTLQHWDHGFKSPFQSEVYFVATTRFNDLKWGTKNPVIARDSEFGMVRLRAFGSYSIRVTEPATFLREIVGTNGEFTSDEISSHIRNIIVQEFSRVVAASAIPVLDMAANTQDFSKIVTGAISPTVAQYGLTIPELYVENISLPDEVEKALDKRTSMGIVGDLNKYTQFQTAEALGKAGDNTNSALGAGLGAGIGMAIGQQGPWGARPAVAAEVPPPPPAAPAAPLWHIAVDGETRGPFTPAQIREMTAKGELTQTSLLWTQGQAGWRTGAEIPALTGIFGAMPPPPPPAG